MRRLCVGGFQIDGDDVEANGCLACGGGQTAEIGAGELAERVLLVGVDGHLGGNEVAAGAGFDFDDAESGAVPGDEVDVATKFWIAPAAGDDDVAVAAKMEESFALAVGTGFEVRGGAGCSREGREAAERPCLHVYPHIPQGREGWRHADQLNRF